MLFLNLYYPVAVISACGAIFMPPACNLASPQLSPPGRHLRLRRVIWLRRNSLQHRIKSIWSLKVYLSMRYSCLFLHPAHRYHCSTSETLHRLLIFLHGFSLARFWSHIEILWHNRKTAWSLYKNNAQATNYY